MAMQESDFVKSLSIIAHVDHGKCFKRGTMVLLSSGQMTSVDSLVINDCVLGIDNLPKKILEIHTGRGPLYKVVQDKAVDYVVNTNHILVLIDIDNNITEISVNDYLNLSSQEKSGLYGFRQNPLNNTQSLSSITVEKFSDDGEYIGFQIDEPTGRFFLGDYTVVHNSTLTDAFVAKAKIISAAEAGEKRFTDGRDDEKERGITIKSSGVSMKFEIEDNSYVINLVDTPGHADFNAEVTSALRITDGAIVVVDAVEGVSVQTKTVLRQALAEQVKPILFINKLDRYIFELQISPEEAFTKLSNIINEMNELCSVYQSEGSELKLTLSPELGNVFFGSARDGYGFGIHNFAKRMAQKFNKEESYYMKKLWGEHFYDVKSNKITTESIKDGRPLERTFCKFVLGPIFTMVNSIMNKETEKYTKMFNALGLKFPEKELEKPEKEIYKMAMKAFIPIADSLLYGIIHHLPSPRQAQRYRYASLYNGPLDDECATAIKNCDPDGPLMIYISKMIPDASSRFVAFGRVFSGTVSTGQKVRILGANYKFGGSDDLYENKAIQRVGKMIGGRVETCDEVKCGHTVALVGIDNYILKSATITTHQTAHPIKTMKFSVSPVVRVSVMPKNVSDLPKLVEGLKKLSKSDPCVQTLSTESEHVVAATGELHVEICLNDLRAFMKSEIVVSEPIVSYRETVLAKSSQICMAKSPNKHNRLYVSAEPIAENLVKMMIEGKVGPKDDVNARSKILVNEFGWDANDSKKIWEMGPESNEAPTNIMVETAKGVQYLNEIKEHVNNGFKMATGRGVLCEEPMMGVRFNLHDANLHADSIHRGAGQLLSPARNSMFAAMLVAQPALLEPIYLVEIQVLDSYAGTIYGCLTRKRGQVISETQSTGNLKVIQGYLPVMESFGFASFLSEQTSGNAFITLSFDHWQIVPGCPHDSSSLAGKVVAAVRKRKGLSPNIPPLENYLDKL